MILQVLPSFKVNEAFTSALAAALLELKGNEFLQQLTSGLEGKPQNTPEWYRCLTEDQLQMLNLQ